MRDYNLIDERGNRFPVAALPTWQIHDLLASELTIDGSDGAGNETVECVRERLRIELVARQIEGRL
jgi:hypothetical protein